MSDRERKRLLVTLAAFAMLTAVGLAYTPARTARLVGDDHVLLSPQATWRWVSLRRTFVEPHWPDNALSEVRTSYYRPLTLATFRLDDALGDSPIEYHFTNVALHVTACALLALFARRLGASGPASVLAALAWGLAPRLTEAVAWVSGRSDVLVGCLSLAALAASPEIRPPRSATRAWLASGASGALLFAAALAKETAIAAAAAILVASLLSGERAGRAGRLAVGLGLPALAYAALRLGLPDTAVHHRELGAASRALTALEALGRYTVAIVDPLRPRASIGMLGDLAWAFVIAGAVALALLVVGLRRIARDRALAVPATLTVAALAPVVQLVPISLAGAVVADRYLYLPLAGVAVGLAVLASRLPERPARIAAGVALAVAVVFSVATRHRAEAYGDEVRFLVEAAEDAHPHNTAPRTALAGLVLDRGPVPLACSLYDRARAIQEATGSAGTTRHRRTRENLAMCLARMGRDGEARAIFEDVLASTTGPAAARAHGGLALVALHTMRFDDAEREARSAAALDTHVGDLAAMQLSKLPEARREAPRFGTDEARAADPVGWARLLRHANRNPEAAAAWLALARDGATPPAVRTEAVADLFLFAPVPEARIAAGLGDPGSDAAAVVFRIRGRRWDAVERLRGRIEALAAGP